MAGLIALLGLFVVIMLVVGGIRLFNNTAGTAQFKDEVFDNFAVTLLDVNGDDIAAYNAGKLAGPMLGAEESDNRLYDIYANKNEDGELQLYIKNEKGCYLPVTQMSVEYIRRH